MTISAVLLGDRVRGWRGACGLLLYLGVTCVVQPEFIFGDKEREEADPVLEEEMLINTTATSDRATAGNMTIFGNLTAAPGSPASTGAGHSSYLVGVVFALLGSTSRAAHYVTCKVKVSMKFHSNFHNISHLIVS